MTDIDATEAPVPGESAPGPPEHGQESHAQHREGEHSSGAHQHSEHDMAAMASQEFWDQRYGSTDSVWSGQPNQRLVEQAADLTPGRALDVGSGEGADAIWLASKGWQVTALDISPVALGRAAERAAVLGEDIAGRITWQQADLLRWRPPADPADAFDLVSAQFMHLPSQAMRELNGKLAAAVRTGGTLLIVGHDFSDVLTSVRRPSIPELYYTATDVAQELDSTEWQVVVADSPERTVENDDGDPVTIRDAIMKAVRRP